MHDQVTVVLKNVKVAYSSFNRRDKYNKFSGSLELVKGSEAHEDFKQAVARAVAGSPIAQAQKSKVIESLLKAKLKDNEKYGDPNKVTFLSLSSGFHAIIETEIDGAIQSFKPDLEDNESPDLSDKPKFVVYGGDIVLIKIKMAYYAEQEKLGCWPQKIYILTHNPAKGEDSEWASKIAEAQNEAE